jgi:Asp/Glu/hydantoin racemase
MTKIGLIRVVSFDDSDLAGLHGRLLEEHFPEFKVVSRCIPDQPKGIYDDETEARAIPKIVDLGVNMEKEDGIAALIISCAADPGVAELRERLRIPVIGAGSSAAALALAFSGRVATLGITEGTPERMRRVLGSALVGETRPEGVHTTLDLMGEAGRRNALTACRDLVRRTGAGVVALACTGFATIGLAAELERESGVPVLDPVIAAGVMTRFYTERAKT